MSRGSLCLALFFFIPLPGLADDWSDALYAEFEEGAFERARKLYGEVDSEEAAFRGLAVLARYPAGAALLAPELEAFKKKYPTSKRLKAAEKLVADPKAYALSFDEAQAAKQRLERMVSLNFDQTPLGDVLDFLRDISGLNQVALPEVDLEAPVSLKVKNLQLANALDLILATASGELTRATRCGSVVIGRDPSALKPLRFTQKEAAAYPQGYAALQTMRLTLNFQETPLEDAIAFLQDVSGLNIVFAQGVDRDQSVRLRVLDQRLSSSLGILLGSCKLRLRLTSEAMLIEPDNK